jgi:hypothetical protein
MRIAINLLLGLLFVAMSIAALRAPRNLNGMQRDVVSSYTVNSGALSATVDFALASGKGMRYSCNPRASNCAAAALKQGLLWKPEAVIWHNGARIVHIELNGQVVLDHAKSSKGRFAYALGIALVSLVLLVASLGLGWLQTRRRDAEEPDWSVTRAAD